MQNHFWTRRSILAWFAAPAVVRRLTQASSSESLQSISRQCRRCCSVR